MKLLIMQSSPALRHFLSLGFKFSSQHPVLKHPQSVLPLPVVYQVPRKLVGIFISVDLLSADIRIYFRANFESSFFMITLPLCYVDKKVKLFNPF